MSISAIPFLTGGRHLLEDADRHKSLSVAELITVDKVMKRFISGEIKVGLNFDVFKYTMAELHGIALGMLIKGRTLDLLRLSASEMLGFIIEISQNYYDNPYHSYYHAVDVTAMVYFMLFEMHAIKFLTILDLAALLLASLGHDLSHPALNNVYQVNAKTDLAMRYDNKSVLENNSINVLMDILKRQNCLSRLKEGVLMELTTSIRDLILATDMQYHFELLERFSDLVDSLPTMSQDESDYPGSLEIEGCSWSGRTTVCLPDELTNRSIVRHRSNSLSVIPDREVLSKQQRQTIINVILHAADISNTVRPWELAKAWSELVVHEFFRQGDKEKQLSLPVSPNMNREQSNQPQISISFGDYVTEPFFTVLHEMYPAMGIFLENIKSNRMHWEELLVKEDEKRLIMQPATLGTLRRVSVAAGTLIIPDKLSKRLSKVTEVKSARSQRSRPFHYRFVKEKERPPRSCPNASSPNSAKTRRSSSVDHTNTASSISRDFFAKLSDGDCNEVEEDRFSDTSLHTDTVRSSKDSFSELEMQGENTTEPPPEIRLESAVIQE